LRPRDCHEHGAIVLQHSDDDPSVGHFELWVAADEAHLKVVQQVVHAIIENERSHAIKEIGDAAHDEISVDGEEERVIHAAVLAERREERGRWASEEVPHVKAVDDIAGLTD
jgi:hypothetical protein